MTQVELAERLGMSKKHTYQLLKGETTLTAQTALKLDKAFSPPADFWLNLEADFRANRARLDEDQKEDKKI